MTYIRIKVVDDRTKVEILNIVVGSVIDSIPHLAPHHTLTSENVDTGEVMFSCSSGDKPSSLIPFQPGTT